MLIEKVRNENHKSIHRNSPGFQKCFIVQIR
jgi:hypothetical protein